MLSTCMAIFRLYVHNKRATSQRIMVQQKQNICKYLSNFVSVLIRRINELQIHQCLLDTREKKGIIKNKHPYISSILMTWWFHESN